MSYEKKKDIIVENIKLRQKCTELDEKITNNETFISIMGSSNYDNAIEVGRKAKYRKVIEEEVANQHRWVVTALENRIESLERIIFAMVEGKR